MCLQTKNNRSLGRFGNGCSLEILKIHKVLFTAKTDPLQLPTSVNHSLACSHDRAWEYFAESVVNPVGFPSLRCNNYESFTNGTCFKKFAHGRHHKVQYMGLGVNKQIKGKFYLATRPTAPFAYNKIYKP